MGCILWLLIIIFFSAFLIVNRLWCFWCRSKVCLVGKTVLITGGVSGIGYQAALALASRGCRVIIADVLDTADAVKKIIKQTSNPNVVGKKLDLASFQSVRDLAKNIIETEPKLNILINNAGIANENCIYTEDGLELTIHVNYFSHFLLTHLLLDTAYSTSKFCMALAAKMFAEKLKGTGVTVNTFHPGGVRTNIFYRNFKTYKDFIVALSGIIIWPISKTPEEGAQTLLYLASADEVNNVTGKFFYEGFRVVGPLRLYDQEFCDKIWERSILYSNLASHEIKC